MPKNVILFLRPFTINAVGFKFKIKFKLRLYLFNYVYIYSVCIYVHADAKVYMERSPNN